MKTTTASDNPKSFEKLQDLVRDIDIAMITTVTPDGALHSRPMVTRKFDADGNIWFFMADDSGMAHDLEAEHAVNVSYADPSKRHYVSVTGNAKIVRNRKKAEELWQSTLIIYFPRGLDDPHLALLCVSITTAEYWDSPGGRLAQLIQSANTAAERGEHTKVEVRAARESG